jgi:hypothetical protein
MDLRDQQYDMIAMCIGNERLKETWDFLYELIENPIDSQRLERFLSEKQEDLSKTAYAKSQHDQDVDYHLRIYSRQTSYIGKIHVGKAERSIHIRMSPQELVELSNELRTQLQHSTLRTFQTEESLSGRSGEYLRDLAALGNYAFRQIFGYPEALEAIHKLLPPNLKTSIQIEAESFFLPWELIYPVDPAEILSYEQFWGMRHIISRIIVLNPRHKTAGLAVAPIPPQPNLCLFADPSLEHVREKEIPFFKKLDKEGKINLHIGPQQLPRGMESLKEVIDFQEMFREASMPLCPLAQASHSSGPSAP